MVAPLVPIVAGAGILGTLAVLRLRATAKAKIGTPAASLTPKETAEIDRKTAAAGIPVLPRTDPNTLKTAAELAKQNEAARIRAAQLTAEQMAIVDANAVVGKTVADFDGNGAGGKVLVPPLNAGDVFPTDRVSINIKAAGLDKPGNLSGIVLPPDVTGDLLVRATSFNTAATFTGVIIDARMNDSKDRLFPNTAITGVGPVDF